MSTASTPKDQLRRVIDEQPDDSTFEELIKELAFAAMVERGLADVQAGRTISHEEMGLGGWGLITNRLVRGFVARRASDGACAHITSDRDRPRPPT